MKYLAEKGTTAESVRLYQCNLQLLGPLQGADNSKPQITRAEYLGMLQTARNLENERIHLLAKVFATTGIPHISIDKLTVASAEKGAFTVLQNKYALSVCIPSYLKKELLDYAHRNGIGKGAHLYNKGWKAAQVHQ